MGIGGRAEIRNLAEKVKLGAVHSECEWACMIRNTETRPKVAHHIPYAVHSDAEPAFESDRKNSPLKSRPEQLSSLKIKINLNYIKLNKKIKKL